jgi:hypothetical protein
LSQPSLELEPTTVAISSIIYNNNNNNHDPFAAFGEKLQQRQIDILQQQPQLGNAGNNDIQNAMKC